MERSRPRDPNQPNETLTSLGKGIVAALAVRPELLSLTQLPALDVFLEFAGGLRLSELAQHAHQDSPGCQRVGVNSA